MKSESISAGVKQIGYESTGAFAGFNCVPDKFRRLRSRIQKEGLEVWMDHFCDVHRSRIQQDSNAEYAWSR